MACTETGVAPFDSESPQGISHSQPLKRKSHLKQSKQSLFPQPPVSQNGNNRAIVCVAVLPSAPAVFAGLGHPSPGSVGVVGVSCPESSLGHTSAECRRDPPLVKWTIGQSCVWPSWWDLHHSIGNRLKNPKIALPAPGAKIAPEGMHSDETWEGFVAPHSPPRHHKYIDEICERFVVPTHP